MALTQKNQLLIAYKKLVGKSHIHSRFGDGNEPYGSGIQLDHSTVFANPEAIPATPALPAGVVTLGAVDGAVQLIEFDLVAIPESEYAAQSGTPTSGITADGDGPGTPPLFPAGVHAYKLALPSNYLSVYGSNPKIAAAPTVWQNSKEVVSTNGAIQIVPPKYGQPVNNINPYDPVVYTNTDEVIAKAQEEDYFLDTFSGILFLQDIARVPDKIRAYAYIGDFLDEKEAVAGGVEGTVQFNKGGLITGSAELHYDYNTGILSGTVAELTELTASSIFARDLVVDGKITANEINVVETNITTIELQQSGSTTFGNTTSGVDEDTHTFSGSVLINGTVVSLANNGHYEGSGSGLVDLRIGNAEGTVQYNDGLFASWDQSTLLSTAIDKFNEVLKGLAPQPAPSLENIESPSNSGKSLFLAFGPGVSDADDGAGGTYTNVTASDTGLAATVSEFASYSLITGTGGRTRLGVLSVLENLTITLNDSTTEDANIYTNYPDNAFNVPQDGVGTFKVIFNGTEIISESTAGIGAFAGTNFNLSAAEPAKFIVSGQEFDLFRHRTGTVTVPTTLANWRPGHNYLKVIHESSLGTVVTNYVDWVYDPLAKNGGGADYIISTPVTHSWNPTGTKYLSGIKYYTGLTYKLSSSVENFYKNTYLGTGNGGRTLGALSPSGIAATNAFGTPPTPTDSGSILQCESLHTVNSSRRLLGQSISSNMSIANTLGKNATSTNLVTPIILLDNFVTANSNLVEDFRSENFRIVSGTYDGGAVDQATVGALVFDSELDLSGTPELICYNDGIVYPVSASVAGTADIGSLTSDGIYVGQPNYSGLTGNRYFFRRFKSSTSTVANISITITGRSVDFLEEASSFTTNGIKMSLVVPGNETTKNYWRDMKSSTAGVGILSGPAPTNLPPSGGSTTFTVGLGGGTLAVQEYFVIRITAPASWQGSITGISLQLL